MYKRRKFKKLFVGDIYKKGDDKNRNVKQIIKHPNIEILKSNALLLKVCKNGYVDIDDIKSYFIFLSISELITNEYEYHFGDLILPDIYNPLSDIDRFILSDSLCEIDFEDELDDINYSMIKKLKKTIKND